jgi:hypothetical protein
VAVREHDDAWQFNPPPDFAVRAGHTLVVIANTKGRQSLEKQVGIDA